MQSGANWLDQVAPSFQPPLIIGFDLLAVFVDAPAFPNNLAVENLGLLEIAASHEVLKLKTGFDRGFDAIWYGNTSLNIPPNQNPIILEPDFEAQCAAIFTDVVEDAVRNALSNRRGVVADDGATYPTTPPPDFCSNLPTRHVARTVLGMEKPPPP